MKRPGHFIKQWRKKKGLSLRKLQDRLINEDGSYKISYASLSRIEKGEQPYSQDVLEGLADALGTDEGSLLMRNPLDPDPIWSIWDRIPKSDRAQALKVLSAFAKTGT